MAWEEFTWGDVDAMMEEATNNEQKEDEFFTPAVSSVSSLSTKFKRFSIFGDSDCGEPSKAQHLVIDFTPDKDFDNPASQKKCCEFWEYINSQPDIQHLCVMPDPDLDVDYNESTTSSVSIPAEPEVEVEEPDKEMTAVSTISLYEKKGILKPAFAPKMCVSKCSLGNPVYSTLRLPQIRVCSCPGVCNEECERAKPKEMSKAKARARTLALCDEVDRWDEKHPKSMEPPGPPLYRRAELQRKPPQP